MKRTIQAIAIMAAVKAAYETLKGSDALNKVSIRKVAIMDPIMAKIFDGKALSTDNQIRILSCLHISENMSGKLEGVNALSTACCVNPVCKARAKDPNSICSHCYAFDLISFRDGLQQATIINFIILNSYLYSKTAWKAVYIPVKSTGMFRIEAFGDVASVIQARNYIRMAVTHKVTLKHVGVWTKNVPLWVKAFDADGKPSNMTFVVSSPYMNTTIETGSEYIDYTFTVYNAQTTLDNSVKIHCGLSVCASCKHCYTKGNPTAVNEILKEESSAYYKAMGIDFHGRRKK